MGFIRFQQSWLCQFFSRTCARGGLGYGMIKVLLGFAGAL